MKSLWNAPLQQDCEIADLTGDRHLTDRLRELGFHSGIMVRVLGQAPFNGPLVVQLHDSVLALRRGEAECLLIK